MFILSITFRYNVNPVMWSDVINIDLCKENNYMLECGGWVF